MASVSTKVDAANRSVRSLFIGLAVDVAVAIATALLLWLPDADLTKREAWIVLGTTLAKTVLQAAASYVVRLKVPPAGQD